MQIRGKGSNLDLHVQSVASCRLDDPGACGRPTVAGARSSVEKHDVLHRTRALLGVHRCPLGERRFRESRPADAVPLRPSPAREIDAVGAGASAWGRVLMSRSAVSPNDVVHATRLPFDPGSPTVDCADPQRSPSYVEGRWSPSSGHAFGKRQAKADANCQRSFRRATLRSFSLRRGLDSI